MKNSAEIAWDVTERIVKLLEGGNLGSWIKPWVSFGAPRNMSNQRPYSGFVNQMLLAATMAEKGYAFPLWATYKQISEMGGQVKHGEKATQVVFFKPLPAKGKKPDIESEEMATEVDDKDRKRTFLYLQYYHVFNLVQTDLDVQEVCARSNIKLRETASIEQIEAFILASGIPITYGFDQASYVPARDQVKMPIQEAFMSDEAYYAAILHELCHATGHGSRLDRDLTGEFGSPSYAKEELIAELGSAFLASHLGLEANLQHPQYLASWLSVLKADPREIFRVAGKARQAMDYLVARYEQRVSKPENSLPHVS